MADNIDALLGLVSDPNTDTAALANQLRGRRDMGNFYSLSTIDQVAGYGKNLRDTALATADKTGTRRTAAEKEAYTRKYQTGRDTRTDFVNDRTNNRLANDSRLTRAREARLDKNAREKLTGPTQYHNPNSDDPQDVINVYKNAAGRPVDEDGRPLSLDGLVPVTTGTAADRLAWAQQALAEKQLARVESERLKNENRERAATVKHERALELARERDRLRDNAARVKMPSAARTEYDTTKRVMGQLGDAIKMLEGDGAGAYNRIPGMAASILGAVSDEAKQALMREVYTPKQFNTLTAIAYAMSEARKAKIGTAQTGGEYKTIRAWDLIEEGLNDGQVLGRLETLYNVGAGNIRDVYADYGVTLIPQWGKEAADAPVAAPAPTRPPGSTGGVPADEAARLAAKYPPK